MWHSRLIRLTGLVAGCSLICVIGVSIKTPPSSLPRADGPFSRSVVDGVSRWSNGTQSTCKASNRGLGSTISTSRQSNVPLKRSRSGRPFLTELRGLKSDGLPGRCKAGTPEFHSKLNAFNCDQKTLSLGQFTFSQFFSNPFER